MSSNLPPKRPASVQHTPTYAQSTTQRAGGIRGRGNPSPVTKQQTPPNRSSLLGDDLEFQGSFTESNNFLEEFVNQAIRNYDKIMQRRFKELDSALFHEVEILSRRISEIETTVSVVKEEAIKSSRVIDTLVDLGKKSRLNNNNNRFLNRKPKPTTLSTAEKLLEGKSIIRDNNNSPTSKHSPRPPESPRPSSQIKSRDDGYFDEDVIFDDYGDQGIERWNGSIDSSVEIHAHSSSPERFDEESITNAWAKFEDLISTMGFNITNRMSSLEMELGECRNMFGQVTLAAEKIHQANQIALGQHMMGSAPFIVYGDGRPGSRIQQENSINAVSMYPVSVPSFGKQQAQPFPIVTNTPFHGMTTLPDLTGDAAIGKHADFPSRPASVSTSSVDPRNRDSNKDAIASTKRVFEQGNSDPASAQHNANHNSNEALKSELATLESKLKVIVKEKAKARKSIKLWVDANTKEGQEPTEEQKEDAKKLFQSHVQIVQEKDSLEKRIDEIKLILGIPTSKPTSS